MRTRTYKCYYYTLRRFARCGRRDTTSKHAHDRTTLVPAGLAYPPSSPTPGSGRLARRHSHTPPRPRAMILDWLGRPRSTPKGSPAQEERECRSPPKKQPGEQPCCSHCTGRPRCIGCLAKRLLAPCGGAATDKSCLRPIVASSRRGVTRRRAFQLLAATTRSKHFHQMR